MRFGERNKQEHTMLKKLISPISYRIIKNYRDKYIMHPVNRNEWSADTINDPDKVAAVITMALTSDKPCMISRFGSNELDATINYKKRTSFFFSPNYLSFLD